MAKDPTPSATAANEAPQADKFKKGDKVTRYDGVTGEVLARVPYKDGDSHRETYTVKGMAGTIPAEALRRAQ